MGQLILICTTDGGEMQVERYIVLLHVLLLIKYVQVKYILINLFK